MKAFRINPEFRILRLTFRRKDFEADFPQKVSLKILNWADYYGFFDLISVYLKTIDHLNLKLLIFIGKLQVSRFDFQKDQDFGNFELPPMQSSILFSYKFSPKQRGVVQLYQVLNLHVCVQSIFPYQEKIVYISLVDVTCLI